MTECDEGIQAVSQTANCNGNIKEEFLEVAISERDMQTTFMKEIVTRNSIPRGRNYKQRPKIAEAGDNFRKSWSMGNVRRIASGNLRITFPVSDIQTVP